MLVDSQSAAYSQIKFSPGYGTKLSVGGFSGLGRAAASVFLECLGEAW
jgi:hypothetical protein